MSPEEVTTVLQSMEEDPSYITKSAYRANAELWVGNRISFVDSHLQYLKSHPMTNPQHYLSNLKLMIRKRG